MARVAREIRPQPDVDYHLDYLFRAWESLPEYAERWASLDVAEQEVFHLEWVGITDQRLRQLRQWAAQCLLTPAQCKRYEALLELVARHRPLLERLLAS